MGTFSGDKTRLGRTRSIRLSPEDIQTLLDRMDRDDQGTAAIQNPGRYSYRIPALQLDVWPQTGSSFTPYSVPTRWLSTRGMSCLLGCFVNSGTMCRVKLITLHGTWLEVEGIVRSCRYVGAHAHDIELFFVKHVDPSLFCCDAVPCRVLLVEDDQLTARMICARLAQLNATVRHVSDGHAALEMASKEQFDLILMDIDLPVLDGFAATQALRKNGYSGRIVAISSLATPEVESQALDVGCDQFLAKPFTRSDLGELLRSLREEPILSAFHNDESVCELIQAFVAELPNEIGSIRQALECNDWRTLNAMVRNLKSQGATYGFEYITKAAMEVNSALDDEASTAEIWSKAGYLLKLCTRVRAPS